jgi:soluble lytic murein transglycosylase-like protein
MIPLVIVMAMIGMMMYKRAGRGSAGGAQKPQGCFVRDYYEVARDWTGLCEFYGDMYGIPPVFLLAVIAQESNGDPKAVYPAPPAEPESWGLAQFILPTATWLDPDITVEDLLVPEISIELMAKYLRCIRDEYSPENWAQWYSHYNGGKTPPQISIDRGECVEYHASQIQSYMVV